VDVQAASSGPAHVFAKFVDYSLAVHYRISCHHLPGEVIRRKSALEDDHNPCYPLVWILPAGSTGIYHDVCDTTATQLAYPLRICVPDEIIDISNTFP
jgi:hypothetical protein